MVETQFDRARYETCLATRKLGRELIALAEVGSTNDVAWERWTAGAPHGLAVVADAQTRGRGRAGRSWHTAPGLGLALSILLRDDVDRRPLSVLPLACGLALVTALERFGVRADLKWPNDVLLGGRKLAGVLCESRGAGRAGAVVIGVGVNVSQRATDFPAGLAATSLAIAGHAVSREAIAAALLDALEPLWDTLAARGAGPILDAWQTRADCWGRALRVVTPGGVVEGVARRLDESGGLVLERAGQEIVVLAGDASDAPTSSAADAPR